ncbi:MAG: hypothetical protein RJA52_442, partial [Bacteroidota bacterium]
EEIFEITEFIQDEAGQATNLIWGNCYDESLGNKLSVTIIATGFEKGDEMRVSNIQAKDFSEKRVISLEDEDNESTFNIPGFDFGISSPNATIFEFEEMRGNKDEKPKNYQKQEYSPRSKEEAMKRVQQIKLSNPKTVIELESEPAYLRRGIKMDDLPDAGKSEYSQYTLSEDEEPNIKRGNSFLHDHVD